MESKSISANEISYAVISKYDALPNKGKPVTKSNGINEWTVLAGIVAIIEADDDQTKEYKNHENREFIDVLTISTGVKALSDEIVKTKSKGRLLHDCHAEILSLRAFNKFIVSECHKVQDGLERSNYMEKEMDDYKFKLKKGISFSMYVSELPCGDCSLPLVQALGSEEQWKYNELRDQDIKLQNGVLRGRELYTIRGKVRTKPGRRDSPLTLSKSCCDKLAITQVKGLLNNIVSQFVNPKGFKLSQLVLPKQEHSDFDDLTKSFHQRLQGAKDLDPFQILFTINNPSVVRKEESQTPANLSLVNIPSLDIHESIVNSVKEGFFNKKTYVRKGGESCISRVKMFEDAQKFLNISSKITYLDVKSSNERYNNLKQSALVELGGWCKTGADDFDITTTGN